MCIKKAKQIPNIMSQLQVLAKNGIIGIPKANQSLVQVWVLVIIVHGLYETLTLNVTVWIQLCIV